MADDDDIDPGMQVPALPFAEPEDLELRWHTLTEAEKAKAEVLLEDASSLLASYHPDWSVATPADLKRLVCTAVKRAMQGGGDVAGVNQMQMTAGPFSQMYSYANPSGDLYFKDSELASIGIGLQQAFSYDMSDGRVSP